MALKLGRKAPAFREKINGGKTLSLSGCRGKNIVLYFYPRDNTPGCTLEACDFRDKNGDFAKARTLIIGVSKDSLKSHEGFCRKYSLPFPLIADESLKLCKAYGVWTQKSLYGVKFMGIERSTFLIDGRGVLRAIWRKVKVKGHAEDVLRAARALTMPAGSSVTKASSRAKTTNKTTKTKPAARKRAAKKPGKARAKPRKTSNTLKKRKK